MNKTILKAAMIGMICASTAFAGTQQMTAKKTLSLSAHDWRSESLIDVVTIQLGADNVTRNVLITVDRRGDSTAGIYIQNCGNVSHVNPGSAVICQLSKSNPVITFHADKKAYVQGTYQVESA